MKKAEIPRFQVRFHPGVYEILTSCGPLILCSVNWLYLLMIYFSRFTHDYPNSGLLTHDYSYSELGYCMLTHDILYSGLCRFTQDLATLQS